MASSSAARALVLLVALAVLGATVLLRHPDAPTTSPSTAPGAELSPRTSEHALSAPAVRRRDDGAPARTLHVRAAESGSPAVAALRYFGADGELRESAPAATHFLPRSGDLLLLVEGDGFTPTVTHLTNALESSVLLEPGAPVEAVVVGPGAGPAPDVGVTLLIASDEVRPGSSSEVQARRGLVHAAAGRLLAKHFRPGSVTASERSAWFDASGALDIGLAEHLRTEKARFSHLDLEALSVATDASGHARWTGIPAGTGLRVVVTDDLPARYTPSLSPEDRRLAPPAFEEARSGTITTTSGTTTRFRVELVGSSGLRGTCAMEGGPVQGFVRLYRGKEYPNGITWIGIDRHPLEGRGEFAFLNLPPGPYRVSIEAFIEPDSPDVFREYLLQTVIVHLEADEIRDLGAFRTSGTSRCALRLQFVEEATGDRLEPADLFGPAAEPTPIAVSVSSSDSSVSHEDTVHYLPHVRLGHVTLLHGLPGHTAALDLRGIELAKSLLPSATYVPISAQTLVDLSRTTDIRLEGKIRLSLRRDVVLEAEGLRPDTCLAWARETDGNRFVAIGEWRSTTQDGRASIVLEGRIPAGEWMVFGMALERDGDRTIASVTGSAQVHVNSADGGSIELATAHDRVLVWTPPEAAEGRRGASATTAYTISMLESNAGGSWVSYEIDTATPDASGSVRFHGCLPGQRYVISPGGHQVRPSEADFR